MSRTEERDARMQMLLPFLAPKGEAPAHEPEGVEHVEESGPSSSPLPATGAAQPLAINTWVARHEHELSQTGPDGTYGWLDGPDGSSR